MIHLIPRTPWAGVHAPKHCPSLDDLDKRISPDQTSQRDSVLEIIDGLLELDLNTRQPNTNQLLKQQCEGV